MADNFTLNPGAGGDVARSKDRAGIKSQVVILDLNTAGAEALNDGAIPVKQSPTTTGGCSTFHRVATASNNAVNVKASAGQVYGITVFNNALYPIYLKFHNTAGTPTAGSGVVRSFGVQAGTQAIYHQANGIAFATGIGITIVKDLADAGTTVLVASDCVIDVEYK